MEGKTFNQKEIRDFIIEITKRKQERVRWFIGIVTTFSVSFLLSSMLNSFNDINLVGFAFYSSPLIITWLIRQNNILNQLINYDAKLTMHLENKESTFEELYSNLENIESHRSWKGLKYAGLFSVISNMVFQINTAVEQNLDIFIIYISLIGLGVGFYYEMKSHTNTLTLIENKFR